MYSATCICLIALANPTIVEAPRQPLGPFLKELAAQEEHLLLQLSKESLWTDPKLKAQLVESIDAAGKLWSARLIPLLAEHIAYEAIDENERPWRLIPLEKMYPCFAALQRVGIPAVPRLIELLKNTNPDRESERQSNYLAILALRNIYREGGFGQKMAKQRLEFELTRAAAEEKKRLQKALQDPALNADLTDPNQGH